MRAIYKKEIRAYLTSMTGYIFIAVLLAVLGLYYTANCLIGGYPVFGVILSSINFILMILIPVLTMRSLSEEKKQKTDQLLFTAPISMWKIVVGKYLAMFTMFLIPMALTCLLPLMMRMFGAVSLPMAYTAIFGYLLFGAACLAIGLFLSALTESQVIAAILTFAMLFFLNMASGIASLMPSQGILSKVLSSISLYERFVNFMQGIFDVTAVIYYLAVILAFLCFTILFLDKKHGKYRIYLALLTGIGAVGINLLVLLVPSTYFKYDVSQQRLFTIGEQTEEIVQGLSEDVTLFLVAQEGGEDTTLLELLERYQNLSSHIQVETKDPVQNPNFTSQYSQEDVEDNSIIVAGENRSKVIHYYDIYQYETDYYSYSTTLSAFDGEGQITSAIAYVTSEEVPVLYTLEGHHEAEMSSSVRALIEKENLEIRTLNLLTSRTVPEDAKILMINGPLVDISVEEKEKILDYMQAGGYVIMLTAYGEEDYPNLEGLLEAYGLELAEGLVLEGDSNYYLPNFPYYLLPDIGYSEVTQNVTGRYVLMPFAQGIVKKEDEKDNLSFESLLTTSDQSYSKVNIESEVMSKEEEDLEGPFDVGVKVTDTEAGTRLICFSTDKLLDEQADSMVSGANSELLMGAVSWMSGHESPVSIAPKSLMVEYLTVPAGSAIFWGLLIVFVIPLTILVTGGVIWVRRRKK